MPDITAGTRSLQHAFWVYGAVQSVDEDGVVTWKHPPKGLGWYDVAAYGAAGTGGVDDTAAIQAAVDACPQHGCVFLPKGTYLISDTISITKSIALVGVGYGSRIVVPATLGATTDVIHCVPATGVGKGHYFLLKDFAITSASGTPGRYGINLDATTTVVQDSLISGVVIYALGSNAIFGSGGAGEGTPILTTIERCSLSGGIVLGNAGDTIRIRDNHITGAGYGLDLTNVSGASTLIFEGNSVTSDGGIHLGGYCVAPQILHNEFETFATFTGSNGSFLDLDGETSHPITDAIVAHNSFQIVNSITTDTIRANFATRTHIFGNRMSRGLTTSSEIITTGEAIDTIIGENLWASGAPVITDAGTGTIGSMLRKRLELRVGASGVLTEQIRMGREADAGRYNSIFSTSNDSGAAVVAVYVHDGGATNTQVPCMLWDGLGRTAFLTMPGIYANNAAAVAGGLTAGHIYRTGANPDVLCVVHA